MPTEKTRIPRSVPSDQLSEPELVRRCQLLITKMQSCIAGEAHLPAVADFMQWREDMRLLKDFKPGQKSVPPK